MLKTYIWSRGHRGRDRMVPVEYGRWNNIPRDLRICHLCNTEDLGDEFHYLLKCACDYFNEKRKICIDKNYLKNYNILKFGALVNLTKNLK